MENIRHLKREHRNDKSPQQLRHETATFARQRLRDNDKKNNIKTSTGTTEQFSTNTSADHEQHKIPFYSGTVLPSYTGPAHNTAVAYRNHEGGNVNFIHASQNKANGQ